MSSRVGAVALLVTGALAACGGRSGGGDVVERPGAVVEETRGRRCALVMEADAVPAFDDLVRAGTRGSLSLWGRGAGAEDSVELSVRYDEEGRLTWVQSLRSTMEPERVTELERLVRSAIAEDGPEDWGVRLHFVGGSVDAVLPSSICEPRRASGGPVRAPPPIGNSREMAELYSALGRRVRAEVALDEKGWVVDVRLPHSSGSRLLDQYTVDLVRAFTYEPKLHDGIGIPSVLTLTIPYRRRM